jgi:hypothetical protein
MNNTNPYIPNGSTPIKNEILFDIIAKGLLSYTEIRIAMYIIYQSWRYVDKKHKRRQDWTNPLTTMQIAKDIEMSYAETCRTLNTMTKSHILLKDGNKYQFNEHYEDYDKKSYMTKSHTTMTNNHTSMTKSHSPPSTNIDEKNAGSSLNKLLNKLTKENISDSLKENSLKENTNEVADSQPVAKVKGKEMQELIRKFCEIMGYEYNPISIRLNVKSAKELLQTYTIDEILEAVEYGKRKYEKENRDPKTFITNLQAVLNSIVRWRGGVKEEKKIQEKNKKGGYII